MEHQPNKDKTTTPPGKVDISKREKKIDQVEKSKGGRPPIFDTDEELTLAINDYFLNGVAKRTVIVGKAPNKEAIEIEVPTITGLCYYIGFASRQSFYDLQETSKFSYTIKRARLFIEKEYEEQLTIGNTTGAIFALKNMGWKDKTEATNINYNVIPTKEESKQIAQNLEDDC